MNDLSQPSIFYTFFFFFKFHEFHVSYYTLLHWKQIFLTVIQVLVLESGILFSVLPLPLTPDLWYIMSFFYGSVH